MTRVRTGPAGWFDRRWRRRQIERLARVWNLQPADAKREYRKIERAAEALTAFADELHDELSTLGDRRES